MNLAVQQVVGLWVSGRQRRRERRGGFTGKYAPILCNGAVIKGALLGLKITHRLRLLQLQ